MSAFCDVTFKSLVQTFNFSSALGDAPHFAHTAPDCNQKKCDFEQDPTSMLNPTPFAGRKYAINRLGPEYAAQKMVCCHNHRRRDEHPPVAIEGKKGQRTKHMEMRFDA